MVDLDEDSRVEDTMYRWYEYVADVVSTVQSSDDALAEYRFSWRWLLY